MQKYNVSVTDDALNDIKEIANFYADLVDVESAQKFENDAYATIESLQTLPEANVYWNEKLNLRRINLKNHKVSVVYTIDKNVFEVVAIATFHQLQKPSKYGKVIKERVL